jgi:single-stranded-DNA-specific exonuclease
VSGRETTRDSVRLELAPYSYAAVRALEQELGVAEPVAVVLARRGLTTPAAAREFLAASEHHDPRELDGIDEAVAAIRAALERDARITVHGDYDVDGVTSTAILVGTLRGLGAACDWVIPDRSADGYGVTMATIDGLAQGGTELLITVDCGIGSVAEVAAARERGIEVVVTDHHQPGVSLPDCPIVHPVVGGYPCPDLCAAGVAYKLACELEGVDRAARHLDLVALATVADMVPLLGENRTLVRRGLEAARLARRPGLRALMAAAGVLPERLEASDLGFRLAPRINAAGRLYRADAGVELMLTDEDDRAQRIAHELDRANVERRETEAEVLADAERRRRELPPELADAPAIVLWGDGWHPGVVGICASRMVERHGRPAVLIALGADGRGKGSGRSIPGFDLLAGLNECAPHLERFGGHRAAAGLEIDAGRLDAFRDSLLRHAAERLDSEALVPRERVDAIVGGESLGYEVAEQLARLGPFGKGNPDVRLLVPAARVVDVRPMGEEERHARFSLTSGASRAAGVAFGVRGSLAALAESGPLDACLRLELNEWNGAVEPRVVLGATFAPAARVPGERWDCPADEYCVRFDRALEAEAAAVSTLPTTGRRVRVDRSAGSGVAAVASLASSGEPVLAVAADALWRRALVESMANPGRFGGGAHAIVASRGSMATGVTDAAAVAAAGGVVLCDWEALGAAPQLATWFTHVVVVDPAPSSRLERLAETGEGFLHTLAEARDPALSRRALELSYPSRDSLVEAWRALGAAGPGPHALRVWRPALGGGAGRSPEAAARGLRVLEEVGVVRTARSGPDRVLEVVSSVRGELSQSASFATYQKAYEESLGFLSRSEAQSSSPSEMAA